MMRLPPVARARSVARKLRSGWSPWRHRPGGRLPAALRAKVDEARWLYIHVPKTGGTSVCAALYGMDIHHRPAREILLFHPVRYLRWRTFTVVRDPVDRFLSAYDYLSRGGRNEQDKAFADRHILPEVNGFIGRLVSDRRFRRTVMSYHHFRPQADFVFLGPLLIVGRLIPFDALAAGLDGILGLPEHAVPHRNARQGRPTRPEDLTPASLRALAGLYARDFRLYRRARPGGPPLPTAPLPSR